MTGSCGGSYVQTPGWLLCAGSCGGSRVQGPGWLLQAGAGSWLHLCTWLSYLLALWKAMFTVPPHELGKRTSALLFWLSPLKWAELCPCPVKSGARRNIAWVGVCVHADCLSGSVWVSGVTCRCQDRGVGKAGEWQRPVCRFTDAPSQVLTGDKGR